MKIITKPLIVVIINSLIIAQIRTGPAPVKIAYLGTQITGFEEWISKELSDKMSSIFADINQDQLINSNAFLSNTNLDSFFVNIEDYNLFNDIAVQTEAEYIFAGKINNASPGSDRLMIQGTFYKYNKNSKTIIRHDILKYYNQIDSEIEKIKSDQLNSIPNINKPTSLSKASLFFGVALLVGILLFTFGTAGLDAEATGNNAGSNPTDN